MASKFESSSSSSSTCSGQRSPCSPCRPESPTQASRMSPKRKAGRKKFKETRHPIFRGIRRKNGEKWVCEVRDPSKKTRIWVGTFPTPEMAARAHDVAALALRGNLAVLNFLDSAWLVPRSKSSSPNDIRVAATEAAEAFRPSAPSSLSLSSSSPATEQSQEKVSKPSLVDDMHCAESTKKVLESCPLHVLYVNIPEDVPKQPRTIFMDEEALFNMPALLDSMAEGLILTPPGMQGGFDWDDLASDMDLTLWKE